MKKFGGVPKYPCRWRDINQAWGGCVATLLKKEQAALNEASCGHIIERIPDIRERPNSVWQCLTCYGRKSRLRAHSWVALGMWILRIATNLGPSFRSAQIMGPLGNAWRKDPCQTKLCPAWRACCLCLMRTQIGHQAPGSPKAP